MNRRGPNITDKKSNLTKTGANKLSDIRRAAIHDANTNEIINLENGTEKSKNVNPAPKIAHSLNYKKSLIKNGIAGPVTIPSTHSMNDILGPDVYSPLYQLANMNLPRDRNTAHAWNRVFYDTHPLVRNAINLHASYPISKINISHPVKQVQEFFLEMAERLDLYSVVYGIATEYWKLGECFPYAELDHNTGTWKKIIVMNPDYIHVKKSPIGDNTIISLKPDAALQRLVSSTAPSDVALKRRLPSHIIDAVQKNKTIPLDSMNISHLKLLSAPYDVRGTSIIVSVWKLLMQYDKLMDSKFAQADGMINPLTLALVGGGTDGMRPTQSDIDSVRQSLEDAQYDKSFTLVSHDGLKIEKIGSSGGILDISADLEFITNSLYIGLMVPKSIVDQEGSSYSSSSIGLEVLRQRYDIFRNMIKKWLEQKIFAPISELQGFFTYVDGKKVIQVPTVDFNHMNLYDMGDYISNIKDLVGNDKISMQTLYRSLGISYDEEQRRLKLERIHKAIAAKETESLAGMRLRELESLDADSIIPEMKETSGMGDGGMGEDAPGLALPGMSPMGDLGGGGAMGAPPDASMGSEMASSPPPETPPASAPTPE